MWRSDDHTITLIDVPQSIATAQGISPTWGDIQLASSEPLKTPYATNEPKSAAAKAKLANNTVDDGLHRQYAELLEDALTQIRAHHTGDWCLPRFIRDTSTPDRPLKRLRPNPDSTPPPTDPPTPSPEPPDPFFDLLSTHPTLLPSLSLREDPPCPACADIFPPANFHANCTPSPQTLNIHPAPPLPDGPSPLPFHLPPLSSFLLSPLSSPSSFHACIRAQARAHSTRRGFDVVLLDPPWPNRSVRRSRKTPGPGKGYEVAGTMAGLRAGLLAADLDVLVEEGGVVGVWITNKAAAREMVVGEGGFFDCWGMGLEEEWVWLKVTEGGEPVCAMEGVWRKPYEVLLVGRKGGRRGEGEGVRRRVLVGVPDLHSRKPCLKGLIEMLVGEEEPRVLEVFARNLVEGWWSWGMECLKFNWKGEWRRVPK